MRQRAATRAALLDAAREVIGERGMESASVSEICDHAGFTRGAFYSNFADRDQLLLAIIDELATEVKRVLASLSAETSLVGLVEEFLGRRILDASYSEIRDHVFLGGARGEQAAQLQQSVREIEQGINDELVRVAERSGREFIVPTEDALELLHLVLTHSIALKAASQRPESDSFARVVLPAVLEGITRPVV